MPLHRIYTPPNLYSAQDKQEWSKEITAWYNNKMPAFYVVVLFIEVPSSSYFIGGIDHHERSKNFKPFVRWTVEHFASHSRSSENSKAIMTSLETMGEKWLKARGYDWEISVGEGSQELWKMSGEFPPLVKDERMQAWIQANAPVPSRLTHL